MNMLIIIYLIINVVFVGIENIHGNSVDAEAEFGSV